MFYLILIKTYNCIIEKLIEFITNAFQRKEKTRVNFQALRSTKHKKSLNLTRKKVVIIFF